MITCKRINNNKENYLNNLRKDMEKINKTEEEEEITRVITQDIRTHLYQEEAEFATMQHLV